MQNSGSTAPAPTALFQGIAAPFSGQGAGGAFSRFRDRKDRKENKHKWN